MTQGGKCPSCRYLLKNMSTANNRQVRYLNNLRKVDTETQILRTNHQHYSGLLSALNWGNYLKYPSMAEILKSVFP